MDVDDDIDELLSDGDDGDGDGDGGDRDGGEGEDGADGEGNNKGDERTWECKWKDCGIVEDTQEDLVKHITAGKLPIRVNGVVTASVSFCTCFQIYFVGYSDSFG
jgi:hypothetical protein